MKENAKPQQPFFLRSGKVIIFGLLLVVQILIGVMNADAKYFQGIPAWYVEVPVFGVLTVENAIKIWGLRRDSAKIPCYVIDTFALIVLTLFTNGELVSTLYIVILSEFYLKHKSMAANIAMGVTSVGLFLITLAVSGTVRGESVNVVTLVTSAVNDLILMGFHFLIFNFSMQNIIKNRELTKVLDELNRSHEELSRAYEELQEVSVLEERQRIAKDIHDTAGHSITTVIMQTEAAKLILETDPEEAKRRIVAANLQAKHALDELRESVHLLSGQNDQTSLRELLTDIIQSSMNGTDVSIRYEIGDIKVGEAKRRFLCNSLKEGISNGLRHGGATAFWFELKEQDGNVCFLLSDNGAGADGAQMKEGLGLGGMSRRAESLGGKAWYETTKDEGFEIYINLPADGNKETT